MERNVSYTLVGVFVALGIVGIIAFTVWIVGSHEVKDVTRYTVYFNRAVNGLGEGSTVRYRGVSVGQVMAIRLDPSQPELIKVDIEVDRQTPVNIETKGSLEPQGITGLSYIQLKTEKIDEGLPIISDGEQYPVIQAEASLLDKLFEGAPQLTSNLVRLADQMSKILVKVDGFMDEQSLQNLTETLNNLNDVSHKVAIMFDDKTVQSTRAVVSRLEQITIKMDRIVDAVATNETAIKQFSGEGLAGMVQLIDETRETMASINQLAESLYERPSRIIFQPTYEGVNIEK